MNETPTQVGSWNDLTISLQAAFREVLQQSEVVIERGSANTPADNTLTGCVVQVATTHSAETWQWCFTKELANFIVDRSLQGTAEFNVRPLTSVDQMFVRKFVFSVLNSTPELPPQLQPGDEVQLRSGLAPANCDQPSESICWTIRLGEFETQMAWRIPVSVINELALGPINHASVARAGELTVLLGEIDIPTEELNELEVGDTIMLHSEVTQPLTAIIDGQAYLVEPGSAEGKKAVRRKDDH